MTQVKVERLERLGSRSRLLLGAILLAGTALRLFRLGADSLWYDETVSTHLAGSPVAELLRHTAGDIHPPGYYLLLRGWLLLTGYGTGRAEPHGNGLEFVSGFFSLFFGVLLIALVYALARKLAGTRLGLVAAALVALSPFNVWYSQEVRMYTLGAVLGVGALWAVMEIVRAGANRPERGRAEHDRPEMNLRATQQRPMNGANPGENAGVAPLMERRSVARRLIAGRSASGRYSNWGRLVVYALAAAAGMYTLYYFAFLLIPLNVWAIIALVRQRRSIRSLLLANLAAAILYAPWVGIAYRQATQPPVPPWRTAPDLPAALLESWTALSFGQSAPAWIWPALLLTVGLFVLGFVALRRHHGGAPVTVGLAVATLGPLFLILVISFATPLYHVRYLFTYSPAFYILLAAGLVALWRMRRAAGVIAGLVLLAGAGVTLRAFWFDPAFRADDHRAAVHELQARWRPGDVVVVNAGWAYTALATYWDGEIGGRYRITGALPEPRDDAALVMVTTGHTDGNPALGWGDPRSDFFAMPAQTARAQVADLFTRFPRVWQYRIYDTVNDPDGLVRALMPRNGQLTDERTYAGEAFMRVEAYAPRAGVDWNEGAPGATFGALQLRYESPQTTVAGDGTLYAGVTWRPTSAVTTRVATSLRLIGPDGATWAQPPDEQPLGPLFPSEQWPANVAQWQPLGLSIPAGTIPGEYDLMLVVYDAQTGAPLPGTAVNGATLSERGLELGKVRVLNPVKPPTDRPALARFGPLALIDAQTPVTAISPGASVPVELLWQAAEAPGEPLVVVVQLLDANGALAAALEEPPAGGRYPTELWAHRELVRDQHTLQLPADLTPGRYHLITGVYRLADRKRFTTRTGLLTNDVSYTIKEIDVR